MANFVTIFAKYSPRKFIAELRRFLMAFELVHLYFWCRNSQPLKLEKNTLLLQIPVTIRSLLCIWNDADLWASLLWITDFDTRSYFPGKCWMAFVKWIVNIYIYFLSKISMKISNWNSFMSAHTANTDRRTAHNPLFVCQPHSSILKNSRVQCDRQCDARCTKTPCPPPIQLAWWIANWIFRISVRDIRVYQTFQIAYRDFATVQYSEAGWISIPFRKAASVSYE